MGVNKESYFRGCNFGRGVILVLAAYIFCASCKNGDSAPDVSNIKINLQTRRFDKDLYSLNVQHLGAGLNKLKEKYPDFLDYYLDTLMAYGIHGNYSDTAAGIQRNPKDTLRPSLHNDLTFKDFTNLEDTILKHYPDNKDLDQELAKAFANAKYYLPDFAVPNIIYVNMALSKWATFPLDKKTLCIGLDMFLGDQFPYYRSVGVPSYMDAHFRRSYLPVSVFSTLYQTIHPFADEDKTLLDLMIQRGKEQYFLHKVLPGTSDSVLFGFTTQQLKWCGENEATIYNFFIHQNLLYSRVGHNITPYIKDGPFAKDMESPSDPVKYTPGNVGTWLGYRIVCAWMQQNPTTNLATLLSQPIDAQSFLDKAQYRPK